MMNKITLNSNQRERAEALLDQLQAGDLYTPSQLVDCWDPFPRKEVSKYAEGEIEVTEKWVPMADVVGTVNGNEDRFETVRIERALKRLLKGEFQAKHNSPLHYMELDGDFYVGADGNHRTLVCKAVGVGRLYADVDIYPSLEPDSYYTRFRRWFSRI